MGMRQRMQPREAWMQGTEGYQGERARGGAPFLCKTNPISAFLGWERGSAGKTNPNDPNSRVAFGTRKRGQVQPAMRNVPAPVFETEYAKQSQFTALWD